MLKKFIVTRIVYIINLQSIIKNIYLINDNFFIYFIKFIQIINYSKRVF